MEIYVLRHGKAEAPAPGQVDPSRRLTLEGKEKLGRVLARVREAGVRPGLLLASPYRRAMETAELAQQALQVESIAQTRALEPLESPEDLWEEIRLHGSTEQLLLVGHDPLLSLMVCYLIGAPGGRVVLKTGAMARVDVESLGVRPAGVLVWLITTQVAGD